MTETEERPRPGNPLVPGLAVAGAALLLAGTFCPVVVAPSGAALSYRELSWADGNVILGAAAVSFVLTWVFRWYRGLFVTAAVAMFMTGATLLKVPRSGLPAGTALAWGWLALAAGAVLLLAAALLAEKERPREEAADDREGDEDFTPSV